MNLLNPGLDWLKKIMQEIQYMVRFKTKLKCYWIIAIFNIYGRISMLRVLHSPRSRTEGHVFQSTYSKTISRFSVFV